MKNVIINVKISMKIKDIHMIMIQKNLHTNNVLENMKVNIKGKKVTQMNEIT